MRTVDRQSVHIEQCLQCRGVFLDAGELERIASAEQRYYEVPPYEPPGTPGRVADAPPPYADAPRAPAAPPPAGQHRYPDSPRPYGGAPYRDSPPPYGHRRRKSFLESLFD